MAGSFVVSLDMELMWGVRSGRTKDQYGHRVLGERQAIPAMLDAFEANRVHATWATVGFAMCDGKDDLLSRAPECRPTYAALGLSSYDYLDEAGSSEAEDPYYFAPSLLRAIASCPGQEIASHTFSHYYCLEAGQTLEQFSADLAASSQILNDFGTPCSSIVFPRNQYSSEHLAECERQGFRAFRGNEASWCYRPSPRFSEGLGLRLARLADSFLPLMGDHLSQPGEQAGLVNVPSSRFLRPACRMVAALDHFRLARITNAMTAAAVSGRVFHLWWHPHNFGADLADNMAFLGRILRHYRMLADRHGMVSQNMAEAAA